MFGIAAPTASSATGAILNPCTGQISGSVTDYFSLGAIPGSAVSITGLLGSSATVSSEFGPWSSEPNPVRGHVHRFGRAARRLQHVRRRRGKCAARHEQHAGRGRQLQAYSSPINTSAFLTHNQAGWGTKPKGTNAGQLLATYFNFLYPTGEMMIGLADTDPDPLKCIPSPITETGQAAIQDFLPQEGKAAPLTTCWIDPPSRIKPQHKNKSPHHRKLGSLAGETLALELNVRFSAFSLTKHGLGDLKLNSGFLKDKKVNDVLGFANNALAGKGLPTGVKTYNDLEDIVERINKELSGRHDRQRLPEAVVRSKTDAGHGCEPRVTPGSGWTPGDLDITGLPASRFPSDASRSRNHAPIVRGFGALPAGFAKSPAQPADPYPRFWRPACYD